MIDLKEQAGVAMNVRSQLGDPTSDPKVTLGALAFAAELGSLLWRMKYGQDVKRNGLRRATLLLASRIRWSGKFARGKFTGLDRKDNRARRSGHEVERAHADIVERFAQRAIVEWVADRCPHCEGRGVFGRSGKPPAPKVAEANCPTCHGERFIVVDEERIPFAHNGRAPTVFREYARCETCCGRGLIRIEQKAARDGRQICPHCAGTARLAADDAARALAIGVSIDLYRTQWERYFHLVFSMLDKIDGSAADTVRRQMRV
jgi:Zn finger protein HypA/HybF involved in hydrogenase expression